MNQFKIKMKFPIIAIKISAKYSETEKPSGLGFLLLKMMGIKKTDMSFRKLLEEFGLPVEMFRLFRYELLDLSKRGMIIVKGNLDADDDISYVELTNEGQRAFDRGVISKEMKDLISEIYFIPAKLDLKYIYEHNYKMDTVDGNNEFIARFKDLEPDFDDLEKYLKLNKEKFGVLSNADVFNMNIKSTEMFSYNTNLTTSFDGLTGTFTTPINGDVDARFVKGQFTAKDFFSSMNFDSMAFSSGSMDVLKWINPSSKFENFDYIIPSDFKIEDSTINIENDNYCSIKIKHYSLTDYLNEYGWHLVKIYSADRGEAFLFENSDVGIAGFEGKNKINVIKRIKLENLEIEKTVAKVLATLDTSNTDAWIEYIEICQKMSYDDKIKNVIFRKISSIELSLLSKSIKDLSIFKGRSWYNDLPSWIEEILIDKKESGYSADIILNSIESLKSTGLKIQGAGLLQNLFYEDSFDNLNLADRCLELEFIPSIVISKSKIIHLIAESILGGKKVEGNSNFYNSALLMRFNLEQLKKFTGIESIDEYSFDIDSLAKTNIEDIKKCSTTLKNASKILIKSPYDLMAQTQMKQIQSFINIFDEIARTLDSKNKVKTMEELNYETHARSFGMELSLHLEKNLKNLVGEGDLANLLIEAKNKKFISNDEYESLDQFRIFRNKCAHSLEELKMPKEKNRWINQVAALSRDFYDGRVKE